MKVKINDVNIRNILKNVGLFRVSKRNNKVLTFDEFFNILDQNKDNDEIIYEILPDETDKEKEAKEYILNLHLDKERELFFLNQIKFRSGIYSYKDLYKLVNYYLNKLSKENIPYKNIYPIIIDDKTYIDNIALFIACLKLDLKPALIDKSFIKKIDEDNLKPEKHGLYICSSGTSFQKLVPVDFDNVLKQFANTNNTKNRFRRYSTVTIKGILGLYTNVLMPVINESIIVINDYNHYFENIDKYKINICYLPTDFENLIESGFEKLEFKHLKKCVFSGGYLNPYILEKIGKLKDKIVQVYGQTEKGGYISQCKYNDMKKIELPFSDLIYIYLTSVEKENQFMSLQSIGKFLIRNYNVPSKMTKSFLKNKKVPFLSIGKSNQKISIKNNGIYFGDNSENLLYDSFIKNIMYGEIFFDGKPTGDIGLIYKDDIYVIYRKNDFNSLIKNYLKERLKIDCQIIQKDYKNIIVFDEKQTSTKNVANIYQYFCLNQDFLTALNFNLTPFFGNLNRSKGLRKVVKNFDINQAKTFVVDERCVEIQRELEKITNAEKIENDIGIFNLTNKWVVTKLNDKYFVFLKMDYMYNAIFKKVENKIKEILSRYGIDNYYLYNPYNAYLLEFIYYSGDLMRLDSISNNDTKTWRK